MRHPLIAGQISHGAVLGIGSLWMLLPKWASHRFGMGFHCNVVQYVCGGSPVGPGIQQQRSLLYISHCIRLLGCKLSAA